MTAAPVEPPAVTADAEAPAGERRRARKHGPHGMSREDDDKAIEATKAPLMDHLVELRSRLIKAIAAFAIAAVCCFSSPSKSSTS